MRIIVRECRRRPVGARDLPRHAFAHYNAGMATPKKSKEKSKADKNADKPVHLPPVVNLTAAAQTAASLLASRRRKAAAENDASAGHVNGADFKKLKDGLATPQHAATSPLAGLNKAVKPAGTAGYNRIGGHHQQSGVNASRTGVPRRTSGG